MLTTSKHLRGATELTLIADLKTELVEIADPTSYAFRLRQVLNLLFNLRQTAIEKLGLAGKAGPLEQLRMIHFVHWSVFDNDRKLLLTVSFDGPWEPYIRAIVDDAGPILDLIFCHCADYAGHACMDGYPQFADWVRRKQIPCDFFFANSPDITVDDIEYLQRFERSHADRGRVEGFDSVAAKLKVLGPEPAPETNRYLRALGALHQLERFFPPLREKKSSDDGFLFARAATLITRDLKPLGLPLLPPALEQLAQWREQVASAAELPLVTPPRDDIDPAALRALVQGNILESYTDEGPGPITHGCAVLVAFDDAECGSSFLRHLRELGVTTGEITTRPPPDRAKAVRRNVGLTRHGLQTLGLSSAELQTFPKEFLEGMEVRGGMFGDVGPSHPDQWQLPELNFPPDDDDSGRKVALPSVDAMVVLQARLPEVAGDHLWSGQHPLYAEVENLIVDRATLRRLRGVQILHVLPLRRFAERGAPPREHFGFVDGVSQPVAQPFATNDRPARDHVALGEILLGFRNAHGERAGESISPPALVRGSTFLVVRKLAQDVEAFERSARESGNPELFKTKVLGRRPDGGALVATGAGGRNDFDYQNDPDGARCPFFSHVRRANPRAADGRGLGPPRIVRRGMGYGNKWTPDDASERGILFMAYASSISDQFETVQRWVNGGNSAGGLSAHPDLVGGTFANHTSRALATMHGKEVLSIDVPDRAFVALRWGLYLFVPSVAALAHLESLGRAGKARALPGSVPPGAPTPLRVHQTAEPARAVAPPNEARAAGAPATAAAPGPGRGDDLIRGLSALAPYDISAEALTAAPYAFTGMSVPEGAPKLLHEDRARLQTAFLAWKSLLEDLGRRADAAAVWAAIRARGGVLRTPYGVLVGTAALVRQVLAGGFNETERRQSKLSVDEYGRRMSEAFGGHYLGIDATDPAYAREATAPNRFIQSISRKEAFIYARDATRDWFKPARAMNQADVRDLARRVVGRVAGKWFGLPSSEPGAPMTSDDDARDERPPARCPVDFQHISQFIFHPNPTATLAKIARARGQVIAHVVQDFLRAPPEAARARDALLADLTEQLFEGTTSAALIGSINGFSVPTSGSFVSVMDQWMESRELWSWQRWLLATEPADERSLQERLLGDPTADDLAHNALVEAFQRTLANAPVPDLLHRTAKSAASAGGVEIRVADRLVVSLASAVADTPPGAPPDFSLLFGGKRAPGEPPHACPGQEMAFGTLLGMLVGVLSEPNLRYEQKLTLGFG